MTNYIRSDNVEDMISRIEKVTGDLIQDLKEGRYIAGHLEHASIEGAMPRESTEERYILGCRITIVVVTEAGAASFPWIVGQEEGENDCDV